MDQYLAFISYRHIKRDQKISLQLRKYLESFHLPASSPIPKRRKCFRDTDELPTSTDLGTDIEHALEKSDYLIAVCSEEYVTSKWCLREIEVFIELGKKERILPVLVSGHPDVSVPEAIRDLPVALDLRNTPSGRVREQIPMLLGIMSGSDASEIASADRRYRNLVLAEITGGLASIMAGLISYSLLTARRIELNNAEIELATTQAVEAESEAEEQIYASYLKRSDYLAQKAWSLIRQGNDMDAIRLTTSLIQGTDMEDVPDYAIYLPDSIDAVDALRAALAMPQRQRIPYRYFADCDMWEYLDADDPSEIGCSLTGRYVEIPGGYSASTTFQNMTYLFESDDPEGRYFRLTVDEYGFPELTEEYSDDTDSLFRDEREDMLSSLPIEGTPACFSVNPAGTQAAVIDSSGHLSLYLTQSGRKTGELEGTWQYVTYANENYRLYAISTEGEFSRIHALTLETLNTYDLPRPAKTASYCAKNRTWLVLTDHFMFVLDAATGDILSGSLIWGEPVACAWEGFDGVSYTHDGNGFMLICKGQISLLRADSIGSSWDHFLFALDGYPVNCSSVSFSPDSTCACLEYENGDLSCWDLDVSDPFLWTYDNRNGSEDTGLRPMFSRDGTAVWVPARDGYGVEKIDTWTGEILFSVSPYQKCNTSRIRESEDGYYALSVGMSHDDPLLLFDNETGELYSRLDGVKDACFSEDGEYILCLDVRPSSDGQAGKRELVFRMINMFSPEITETVLCELEEGEDIDVIIDQETLTAAVGDSLQVNLRKLTGAEDPEETEGADEAAVPEDPDETAVLADPEGPDETEASDDSGSPVTEKKTREVPLFFAGEEAFIRKTKRGTLLVNAEDGHTIIDAGGQQITISPDGECAILYGNDQAPFAIFAQDQGALLSEASQRLEDYEEEAQEWLEYSEEDFEEWYY